MEKGSKLNYSQQVELNECELIVKEELFDELNDDMKDSTRCGEIFLLQTRQMLLICGFCEKPYWDMNEFGAHVQESHISKEQATEHFVEVGKEVTMEIEYVDDGLQDYEDIPHDEEESDEPDYSTTSEVDDFPVENTKKKKRRNRPSKTKAQRRDVTNPAMYCTICQRQYENKARFRQHNEITHNILRPCEFCNKPFDTLEERSEHEKTHVGDTPYPCPKCPLFFRKKYTRDKHIEHIHDGIKPHKCFVCDRSFATGTMLRGHQTVHSLPGRYSCEICGRQFAYESRKKVHMRTHTGDKTYQCEECGNRYSNQALLTDHKKYHTGEKNVECKICGKKFYTKRLLRGHVVIHSSVRRHSCLTCGQSFKKSNALKQHMKLHSDVKEYSCNICGKEFAQVAGLYSHKKSHMNDATE